MHPRARTALLIGMAAWTLFTAAVGLYAMQGTSAAGGDALTNAGLPGTRAASAGAGTPGSAARTPTGVKTGVAKTESLGTAVPTFSTTPVQSTPTTSAAVVGVRPRVPSPTPRAHPVPQYAQNAGADGSASISGGGSTSSSRDAALLPAKGVVVLDPGHGRGDPGAVHSLPDGTPDVLEAGSNLRNAILIRDELVAMGYEVYLTRDDAGRAPDGPLAQQFITSDLIWRAQLADAVDADVFLALHGNGASVKSISGPETWYCGHHEQGSANERLAALVQMATMDGLHEYGYFPPNRGIVEDAGRHHSGDFCEFVVTRETTVPSALLEFLFLSNDDDARVLADDLSHQVLARHVAAAIDRFLTQ